MGGTVVDAGIIGTRPYRLSIAAFLGRTNLSFRIFGTPMQSCKQALPKGMRVKSDGVASGKVHPPLIRHTSA